MKKTYKQYLFERIELIPFHECWEWKGTLDKDGYGAINLNKKRIRAHRFSYESYFGPIPKGMLICHKCDNPGCVRPEHLFMGTTLDNVRDKIRKGRLRVPLGEEYKRGLTETEVIEIINYPRKHGIQTELAKRYNVSQSTIYDIIFNRTWRHLTRP